MNITLRNLPHHIRMQDILGELREKFGCTFRWADGEVIGEFSEARPARPCPFCGGTNLVFHDWVMDDASDVLSIECSTCYGAAPYHSWQRRQG
jgi:hypothetical protein